MCLTTPSEPTLDAPNTDESLAAYSLVEKWVRDWEVPQTANGAPRCSGACVTLRLNGAFLGRGEDITGDDLTIIRAARAALSRAEEKFSARRDALENQRRKEIAERITISLELAGPLVPFRAETYPEVDLGISPGLLGIGARFGEKLDVLFPSEIRAGNFTPGEALRAAVSTASGDSTLAIADTIQGQPGRLAKDRGAVFYRFRVSHLAQCAEGSGPMFLHRGQLISPAISKRDELVRFAGCLSRNLAARVEDQPAVGTFVRGTYHPCSTTGELTAATISERALLLYSLKRYSRSTWASGNDATHAAEAIKILESEVVVQGENLAAKNEMEVTIARLLRLLATLEDGTLLRKVNEVAKHDTSQSTNAPATDTPVSTESRGIAERQQLAGHATQIDLDAIPIQLRGLGSLCRARAARAFNDEESLNAARASIRSVYRDTRPGMIASHMPWLGWAELAVTDAGQPVAAAAALREMRDLLYEHQVKPEDTGEDDRDMAGGFIFTGSRTPLPTWHSARPLAFLATMLGEPRLTDEAERMRELTRLMHGLRFIRQLTADEACGHAYEVPSRAMWGVRSSVWDQRQPIEATAMSLLAVCEAIDAIDAMTRATTRQHVTNPESDRDRRGVDPK